MQLMLNSLICHFLVDPFLNSGVMFASFHSEGTIPPSSDKLNTFASDVLICSKISLSSSGGIPSTPVFQWSNLISNFLFTPYISIETVAVIFYITCQFFFKGSFRLSNFSRS